MKWCPQPHAAHNQIVFQLAIINESKMPVHLQGKTNYQYKGYVGQAIPEKENAADYKKADNIKKYVRFRVFIMVKIHSALLCVMTLHTAAGTNSSQKHTFRTFTPNAGSTCSKMQFPHSLSSLIPPPQWPGFTTTLFATQHSHLAF
jgi:hypothetical protein